MVFLENQRRLGRRVKHGCVVAGPCFALYSDEAAWGRWGEWEVCRRVRCRLGLVHLRRPTCVACLALGRICSPCLIVA